MKKLLIGCGVVLLIMIICAGILIWKVAKGVGNMVQKTQAFEQKAGELNTRFAFTPPTEGVVSGERLDGWIAAHTALADIENYDDLDETDVENMGFMEAMRTGLSLMFEPAEALLEGLEQQNMSPGEGNYIKDLIASALGNQSARNAEGAGDLLAAATGSGIMSGSKTMKNENAKTFMALMIERKETLAPILGNWAVLDIAYSLMNSSPSGYYGYGYYGYSSYGSGDTRQSGETQTAPAAESGMQDVTPAPQGEQQTPAIAPGMTPAPATP